MPLSEKEKARRKTPEYRAKQRALQQTPEYIAYQKAYKQTPEYKAQQAAYAKKRREDPEYKAQQAAYQKKRREDPEFRAQEKAKHKVYLQTPAGIKSNRISKWKSYGVICDDWDVLYEKYINTEFCEDCKCELTEDRYNTKTTRCLDHDHNTGLFRNVVCNSCNAKLPRQ